MPTDDTPATSDAPTVDSTGRLRRAVRFRHLVGNGLVFIGPAAAVGIYGVVYARSGGPVGVVYVLTTIVMGLTAVSYAQMSRAVPKAGSVFSYATAGIGPSTGFVAGWMVLLDYMLIPSVAFLFTGIAVHSFLPAVPTWVLTGAAIVLATAFNLAGVKSVTRVAMLAVIAETVVLAAVLVGAVVAIATHGVAQPVLAPLVGSGGFSLTAVVGAVSVAMLTYLGFDAIATFAEETTGGSSVTGRAMLVCLALVGVLFFVQSYLVQLLTPMSPQDAAAQPDQQETLYYDVVLGQVTPWLSTSLAVAKAIGACFAGMMGLAAGSRVMMTMAAERRLPRGLGRISRRTGIPATATVLITAVTLVVSVGAARLPGGLDLLSSLVSVGALCAFLLLHVSVVGYFTVRGRRRRYLVHLAVPTLAVASFVPVLVLAAHLAQLVGASWLAIGLVVAVVQQKRAGPNSGESAR